MFGRRNSDLLERVLEIPEGRDAIHGVAITGEIACITLKDGRKVYIVPDSKLDQVKIKGMTRVKRRTLFGIPF